MSNKIDDGSVGTFVILFVVFAMFLGGIISIIEGPSSSNSTPHYLEPSEQVLRYREEKRKEELRTNLEALQVIDDWNNDRLK